MPKLQLADGNNMYTLYNVMLLPIIYLNYFVECVYNIHILKLPNYKFLVHLCY